MTTPTNTPQTQNDTEYLLQKRVYDILEHELHYENHGCAQYDSNVNIEEDELFSYLSSKYTPTMAKQAISRLVYEARKISAGLSEANIRVADLIFNGIPVKDEDGEPKTVYVIDFDTPNANTFYFKYEVTVGIDNGDGNKRPDIVIYINGIAIAVFELKGTDHDVSEAIRQNITNQSSDMIPRFFTTVAVCVGANALQGMKLGAVCTDERHYYPWREDAFTAYPEEVDENDRRIAEAVAAVKDDIVLHGQLLSFFDKRRFIEYMKSFIIVEKGRRKALRYNQYYGVKRDNKRREDFFANPAKGKSSGIINHGPGSGKTLTMEADASVFIRSNAGVGKNGQVLLLVDRHDLEQQNSDNFSWLNPHIVERSSDLLDALNDYTKSVIVVLIHKFGSIANDDAGYAAAEQAFNDFAGKVSRRRRLVLTDECHRTQSGKLHDAMKRVLPKDLTYYTGFTGTTDTSDDDTSTLARYGDFVHAYDTGQAEADKAVVPICYENRSVIQEISDAAEMDRRFEKLLADEAEIVREKLKLNWASDEKLRSTDGYQNAIALDIKFEFGGRDERLMFHQGNAILLVPSVERAFSYYKLFNEDPRLIEFRGRVFPITSYRPDKADLITARSEVDDFDEGSSMKYRMATEMFGDRDPDLFEAELKKRFIDDPSDIWLFILVDRLNTGFDAPSLSTVFIDRDIDSPALIFQSINRANRVEADKIDEYGNVIPSTKDKAKVIDYSGNYAAYRKAVKEFTLSTVLSIAAGKDKKEALDDSVHDDGRGSFNDAKDLFIDSYEEAKRSLEEFCSGVEEPKESRQYQEFFCGFAGDIRDADGSEILRLAALRRNFYQHVGLLAHRWHDARPYYIDEHTAAEVENEATYVKNWVKLKEGISNASGDTLDSKAYDRVMEQILNEFVKTEDKVKSNFEVDDLVGILNGKPDEIVKKMMRAGQSLFLPLAGRLSTQIVLETDANPVYGARLSEKLQSILDRRNARTEVSEELYKELVDLAAEIARRDYTEEGNYPPAIDNNLKSALYDNITGEDVERSVAIFNILRDEFDLDWADPEVPLSDPCFADAKRMLDGRLHLDSGQIDRVLKLARANVADIRD